MENYRVLASWRLGMWWWHHNFALLFSSFSKHWLEYSSYQLIRQSDYFQAPQLARCGMMVDCGNIRMHVVLPYTMAEANSTQRWPAKSCVWCLEEITPSNELV